MTAVTKLVKTALRVLIAWNEGREPASADIRILKQAPPSPAHLTPDEFREAAVASRLRSGRVRNGITGNASTIDARKATDREGHCRVGAMEP